MTEFEMHSSDSEDISDDDAELQRAFADGEIKPGLNKIVPAAKQHVNNIKGLTMKYEEFKLNLPWIELLDNVNKEAPLAPELAAKMHEQEQKRANQLKNNKKLQQFAAAEDPVLNDFKREMMFHRQAQATVMQALPKLKAMGIATIRPDDYFAEMAKTDAHMQKIRASLMQKQAQQQRSERVKELRAHRKEGKAIQIQTKLQRLKEKKDMMDQVKKVRKGVSKDLSFLDGKKGPSKKSIEKRKMKDKKFGFGGKKRGLKANTKESAADISEYKKPKRDGKFAGGKPGVGGKGAKGARGKRGGSANGASKRPGKNRRAQSKSKGRK